MKADVEEKIHKKACGLPDRNVICHPKYLQRFDRTTFKVDLAAQYVKEHNQMIPQFKLYYVHIPDPISSP